MIEALRVFDVIYVLTGGGPGGATTSLSLLAYGHYAAGDLGYGAATSTVLFLATFALALVTVRLGRFGRELA
jgi:multiple sugar transport system permease protein